MEDRRATENLGNEGRLSSNCSPRSRRGVRLRFVHGIDRRLDQERNPSERSGVDVPSHDGCRIILEIQTLGAGSTNDISGLLFFVRG